MSITIKRRRQIRTTLAPEYERMLAGLSMDNGEKESDIVRRAIVKYLRSYFSNEVISKEKEMSSV